MEELAKNLMEELECKTVFTIPVLGGLEIKESIVVTWIIMAVLILLSIFLTRNMKIDHISKRQAVAELIVTKLTGIVEGMIGEKGKAFVPYLITDKRFECYHCFGCNEHCDSGSRRYLLLRRQEMAT